MAHRRTRIRDAALASITDIGLTTVTKSRLVNYQPNELPAASVYTLTDPTQAVDLDRTQERTLRLVVDIFVRTAGDPDDEADDWCVLVEKALDGDYKFGGLALNSGLVNTTIGLTGEGEARLGLARLEYDVVYRVNPSAPDA